MMVLVIGIVCVNFHHGNVQCSSSQIFKQSASSLMSPDGNLF